MFKLIHYLLLLKTFKLLYFIRFFRFLCKINLKKKTIIQLQYESYPSFKLFLVLFFKYLKFCVLKPFFNYFLKFFYCRFYGVSCRHLN